MRQPSIRSVKVRESPCPSALLFCRSRGHETLIMRSCPSSVPSVISVVHPLRLCSAIPENCVFPAQSSKPSFRMTNEKFSMTDSQFRRSALVAACRAVSLRLGVLFSKQQAGVQAPVQPRSCLIAPSRTLSQRVKVISFPPARQSNRCKSFTMKDLPVESRRTCPSACHSLKIAKRTQIARLTPSRKPAIHTA